MNTKSGVWQFYQDGEWRVGMNVHSHRENTESAGIPTRDLHVIPEGYALVPIERIQISLETVQNAMQDAYSNAYLECCGRSNGSECCGMPDAVWNAEDQQVMDALAPAQRELSALISSAQDDQA